MYEAVDKHRGFLKPIRCFLMFVTFLALFSAETIAAHHEQMHRISVPPLEQAEADGGRVQFFSVEGYGSTLDIYMPNLPVKTYYFEVPYDSTNIKVRMTRVYSQFIDGVDEISELLPPVPADPALGYTLPARKPHSHIRYPEDYFSYNGVKLLNDHRLVSLTVFPVHYYFKDKYVEYSTALDFVISYDLDDAIVHDLDDGIVQMDGSQHKKADGIKVSGSAAAKPSERLASELIANYEDYADHVDYADYREGVSGQDGKDSGSDVPGLSADSSVSVSKGDVSGYGSGSGSVAYGSESITYGSGSIAYDLPSSVDIKYVIITTELLESALVPLREWKTQKGVPAEIYTTEDIYSGYSGSDNAEKIRNFLVSIEQDDDIDWVLLAGDVSDVPTRSMYCPDDYSGDGDYLPSDYYYADLEGGYAPYDWDKNNNSVYGEVADEIDWLPEAYVGRLSTSSSAVMQVMVSNIINYERTPAAGDWTTKAIIAGGQIREDTDDAYLMNKVKVDFLDTNGYSYDRIYFRDDNFERDYALTFSNFQSRTGLGAGLIDWSGHGAYTYTVSSDVGGETFVSTATSPGNSEKRPVVYASSCNNGAYDQSTCLSEDIIRDWGIGVVAGSRVTWGCIAWSVPTQPWNQALSYRFFEQLLGYGKYSQGQALYDSKVDYISDFSSNHHPDMDSSSRKDLFAFNLMGDPELPVWTGQPQEITIDCPGEFFQNSNNTINLTVKYSSNSSAVAGATVAIYNGVDIYSSGTTDSQGNIVFSGVETESIVPIRVTALGHNLIPKQANISASQVYVSLLSPIGQPYINPDLINFTYVVNSSSDIVSCSLLVDGVIEGYDSSVTKGVEQHIVWDDPYGGNLSWAVECTDSQGSKNSPVYEDIFVTLMSGFDGSSTNISEVDIENIENLVIEQSDYGVINFTESINLSSGADIDTYVKIGKNRIEINSTAVPSLNRSAILTLRDVLIPNPVILRDGELCTDCVVLEYGWDYIVFSVGHFSSYSAAAAQVGQSGRLSEGPLLPGNVTAQGGNVTQVNLESNTSTAKWQGFYGNVYGKVHLGYGTDAFYNFGAVNITAVYATQNQSFDWANMNETYASDIDNAFGFTTASDIDQGQDIFVDDSLAISGITTTSLILYDGNFESFAVDCKNTGHVGYFAFGGVVNNSGEIGFDGGNWQYELMVPVAAGNPVYYFFMES